MFEEFNEEYFLRRLEHLGMNWVLTPEQGQYIWIW